ncbi:MAG: diguanylate cyclase [Candidatus Thiodiazotropha sp. (ex Epidulcina cf. delphinae)]|nr:diguanylate cyclase [Candidatus Thiodiazotropha sp. (ex Epidulcina cf. delphinae)]
MDLNEENRILRQRLSELTQKAQDNQETLGCFHARELDLLSAESLPELWNGMTDGLKSSFEIKSILMLLCDPDHEIRHLPGNNGIDENAFPFLRFVDDMVAVNPRFSRLRSPWLGPFLTPEYDNLFCGNHRLGSIAILPLFRSNRLMGSINPGSDASTRFGGEEFALLLPQTCLNEALMPTERIRLEVSTDPIPLDDGNPLRLSVSIGVSEALPMLGKSRHKALRGHLLANADQALYMAKANGRNRIEYKISEGLAAQAAMKPPI